MKNAHSRFAKLAYAHNSASYSTNITVDCNLAVLGESKTHVLSLIGTDSSMATISAALFDNRVLTLRQPDGSSKTVAMGKELQVFQSSIKVPGRKFPLRHKLFFSEEVKSNGSDGYVYIVNQTNSALVWSLVINTLGVPAMPQWQDYMLSRLRKEKRIEDLVGFNCSPIRVLARRDDLLEMVGEAVREKKVCPIPEKNGSLPWRVFTVADAITPPTDALAL